MGVELRYRLTGEMEEIFRQTAALQDFARWFELDSTSFDTERKQGDLSRLLHYLPPHTGAVNEQQIMHYVNQPDEHMTRDGQRLINIRRAIQYCRATVEPYGIPLLQHIHNILLNKMPDSYRAARIRGSEHSLFTPVLEGYPHPYELDSLMDDFTRLAEDQNIPPLVRVWLLYFFLISVHFFESENETLAAVFCYNFLQREGYGFQHLLKLEKYVFHSKKFMAYSITHTEHRGWKERFAQDMSPFIQICLQGFAHNLEYIKQVYLKAIRERMDFEHISTRKRNALNFWLEEGFELHRERLDELNSRQRQVLMLLIRSAELSVAEAASLCSIDKKTAQDDLFRLSEMGISYMSGGGRNVRFSLNFAPGQGTSPLARYSL